MLLYITIIFVIFCNLFRQVESSRQMYHAVMEEVARFLERCYQSLDAFQQNNQMGRSRSVNHVFEQYHTNDSTPDMRMRSSTNLLDKSNTTELNETITSNATESYKNFSDFTW